MRVMRKHLNGVSSGRKKMHDKLKSLRGQDLDERDVLTQDIYSYLISIDIKISVAIERYLKKKWTYVD